MPDLLITDIDDDLAREIEQTAAREGLSLEDWRREALNAWARANTKGDSARETAPGPWRDPSKSQDR